MVAPIRALAHEHDERVAGRSVLAPARGLRVRHALEVRHPSFVDPAFITLLRRHRVALVVADTGASGLGSKT